MMKVTQINDNNFLVCKDDTKLQTVSVFKTFEIKTNKELVYFNLYCYQLGKTTQDLNEIQLQRYISKLFSPMFSFDIKKYPGHVIIEYTCKYISPSDKIAIDETKILELFEEIINQAHISEHNFKMATVLYNQGLSQISSRPNSYVLRQFKDSTVANHLTLEAEIDFLNQVTCLELNEYITNMICIHTSCLNTAPLNKQVKAVTNQSNIAISKSEYLVGKDVVIDKELNQASCIFHLNVKNNYTREQLQLFCYCLGQDDQSILFQTVREEHNLCYSISAQMLNLSNIIIRVNTSAKNIDQVETLVKSLVNQSDSFEYFESQKQKFLAAYRRKYTDLGLQKSFIYGFLYDQGILTIDEKISLLSDVSKEDILAIASDIKYIKKVVVK